MFDTTDQKKIWELKRNPAWKFNEVYDKPLENENALH